MENNTQLIPKDKEGNPTYIDLCTYKKIINMSPKKSWVKTNPYANNAKYLPIGIVEELLNKIFPFWQVEQHGSPQILGNSIVISVNLKVYHPLLEQWLTYAGIGAVPIELERGAKPLEFDKINPKAMHKNVPAALSFAVNNAAKKIGKLFGSHLNRNEEIA